MPRRPFNPTAAWRIKARVRERDGFRCAHCGMSNDQHKAETGKQLDVHRLVPGTLYTVEGCVTLCKACHGPQVRRKRGTVDLAAVGFTPPTSFAISADTLAAMDWLADRMGGLSRADVIRQAVHEAALAEGYQKTQEKPSPMP